MSDPLFGRMDPIEQIINSAKHSAMNDEQKSRAEIASIVYASMKIQHLQSQVIKLQEVFRDIPLSGVQRESLDKALRDDYAEIQRLMASLNVECEEQLLEVLKGRLG